MSKQCSTKNGNAPVVKLTKACLLTYGNSSSSKSGTKALPPPTQNESNNYNDNNNIPCPSPCIGCLRQPVTPIPEENNGEVEFFQSRVGALRRKLDEANANICTLRAFVVNTIDQINNKGKPKTPIETADEIRKLLVILEEIEEQNNVVMERGVECVKIIDNLESTDCRCGPSTPSVEKIRRELIEINQEQLIVDEKIAKEKGDTVSKVHQSSSIAFSPRKASHGVATGTQLRCSGPGNKPKILQTDTKYSISTGTNPSGIGTSSKGQTAKLRCGPRMPCC